MKYTANERIYNKEKGKSGWRQNCEDRLSRLFLEEPIKDSLKQARRRIAFNNGCGRTKYFLFCVIFLTITADFVTEIIIFLFPLSNIVNKFSISDIVSFADVFGKCSSCSGTMHLTWEVSYSLTVIYSSFEARLHSDTVSMQYTCEYNTITFNGTPPRTMAYHFI